MEQIEVPEWKRDVRPKKRGYGRSVKSRRRRRRRYARLLSAGCILLAGLLLGVLAWGMLSSAVRYINRKSEGAFLPQEEASDGREAQKPLIEEAFLTPNPYSRPGEPLPEVKNIFIHYTANPGTTAEQNRSYFENLGITGETSASAHFVIGFDGTILQCIPLDEIGYAVKTRNYDSVSIECCYQSADGSFTEATYDSLIRLTAWLLEKYGLTPADVLRHYDVGGKKCPLYFVENEEAWEGFRQELSDYIRKS